MIKLGKTIKARYKDGVFIPLEPLDIPDDTDITITIKTIKIPKASSRISEKDDWQKFRGILKGTNALQDHERERQEELAREEKKNSRFG